MGSVINEVKLVLYQKLQTNSVEVWNFFLVAGIGNIVSPKELRRFDSFEGKSLNMTNTFSGDVVSIPDSLGLNSHKLLRTIAIKNVIKKL